MALTACQAIQKPASQKIRGCVSVYCVSPGWAAPWRSVISDLWQSPWITGQYRHSIKPACFSQRLWRLDRNGKKKDDNYFPCFTWPSCLFLLWSFAGLLAGFLSEGWSDNTRRTPTIMQPLKYEKLLCFSTPNTFGYFELLYKPGKEQNGDWVVNTIAFASTCIRLHVTFHICKSV